MSTHAMASPPYLHPPNKIYAILLGGTVTLFLGALLSDIAHYNTYEIQWTNFASWLIAAGLLFCGLALLFALVGLVRARHKKGHPLVVFLLLLATWVLGFINALQHARDAWGVMPAGLILSIIVLVLSLVSAWMGLAPRTGGEA